jgi:hypothetical protein
MQADWHTDIYGVRSSAVRAALCDREHRWVGVIYEASEMYRWRCERGLAEVRPCLCASMRGIHDRANPRYNKRYNTTIHMNRM